MENDNFPYLLYKQVAISQVSWEINPSRKMQDYNNNSVMFSSTKGGSRWAIIDSMQHFFNPSIEGLRGIAVSLTMICHILPEQYQFREVAGNMGVCIFFVLSGFLITAVLIRLQVG